MRARIYVLCPVVILFSVFSQAATLDFEGLPDGVFLGAQFAGIAFANTQIATAGISLNEFEFPPHSGRNVAIDSAGPISVVFLQPVSSVSGYFTYATAVRLDAYDARSSLVGSVSSAHATNQALSGVPGSSPNEYLRIRAAGGVARLTITGDPSGSSFALDDLTYTAASAVTEPSTFEPVAAGLLILCLGVLGRRRCPASAVFREARQEDLCAKDPGRKAASAAYS